MIFEIWQYRDKPHVRATGLKRIYNKQEAVLATKIQREVSQSMDYAFLNDDVWQDETMTKDLADNYVQI